MLSSQKSKQLKQSSDKLYKEHISTQKTRDESITNTDNSITFKECECQYIDPGHISFQSIVSSYQQLKSKNRNNKRIKRQNIPINEETLKFVCECGREYQKIKYLEDHIKLKHNVKIQDAFFLKLREILIRYKTKIPKFEVQHANWLVQIQELIVPSSVKVPQEMTLLFSKSNKRKIIKTLHFQSLSKQNMKNNFYFNNYNVDITKIENQYLLSDDFMKKLGKLITRHISEFKRNFNHFLKLMNLSQLSHLFLYNLIPILVQCLNGANLRSVTRFYECVFIHFLDWVDKNYIKVLNKYNFIHLHIQLNNDQKYTQVQRSYLFSSFIKEYELQLHKIIPNKMIHKAASYLLIAMSELITSLKLDQ